MNIQLDSDFKGLVIYFWDDVNEFQFYKSSSRVLVGMSFTHLFLHQWYTCMMKVQLILCLKWTKSFVLSVHFIICECICIFYPVCKFFILEYYFVKIFNIWCVYVHLTLFFTNERISLSLNIQNSKNDKTFVNIDRSSFSAVWSEFEFHIFRNEQMLPSGDWVLHVVVFYCAGHEVLKHFSLL